MVFALPLLGWLQRDVFSPDPGERTAAAAESLVNVMGLSETSVLAMGVKLCIRRCIRLHCPGSIETRNKRGPAELANKTTTLKPTCWKPRMLVGWVLQHHLQQKYVTVGANLPDSRGVRRADHPDRLEEHPAPFAWYRQHNAGRCARCHPPATLRTASTRHGVNAPFLWGTEPTVPPTAPRSCSLTLPASLGAPPPIPPQKSGALLALCPVPLTFHPETGICSPLGETGSERCLVGKSESLLPWGKCRVCSRPGSTGRPAA